VSGRFDVLAFSICDAISGVIVLSSAFIVLSNGGFD
jgi:hypothetical protein